MSESDKSIEPLLIRHQDAARVLGLGETQYWKVIKSGEIPVVGQGRGSRAYYPALKRYVAKLLAEAVSNRTEAKPE